MDFDDAGDDGVTDSTGGFVGGGVGGYECRLDVDECSWNVNASLTSLGASAGMLVRVWMDSAASA